MKENKKCRSGAVKSGRMLAEKSGEKLVAVVFGKDNAEAIEQIKGYDLTRSSVYPVANMRNTALTHIPMQ